MRRIVGLSAVALVALAGCGGSPKTALGRVASTSAVPQVTGVYSQMPDQKWPPEGSFLERNVSPRAGNTWLVVVFEQAKGEFSFDLRQCRLTVEGLPGPIACWGASANGGKQFILESLAAPAQTAEIQGVKLTPALAFEVPASARAATLTVRSTQVPLEW